MVLQRPELAHIRVFTIEGPHLSTQELPYIGPFGKNEEKVREKSGNRIESSRKDGQDLVAKELLVVGELAELIEKDAPVFSFGTTNFWPSLRAIVQSHSSLHMLVDEIMDSLDVSVKFPVREQAAEMTQLPPIFTARLSVVHSLHKLGAQRRRCFDRTHPFAKEAVRGKIGYQPGKPDSQVDGRGSMPRDGLDQLRNVQVKHRQIDHLAPRETKLKKIPRVLPLRSVDLEDTLAQKWSEGPFST